MANQNLKSPRFWTPKLIIDARHASCYIWYGGQVMKAWMKKPHGSSPPRLTMLLSLSKIFTSLIQLNLDHYCFLHLFKKKKKKKRDKRLLYSRSQVLCTF